MSTLEKINGTSTLAGSNEVQLLAFTLSDNEQYAINIFKVREVVKVRNCDIENAPKSVEALVGIMPMRDDKLFVVDLSTAMGLKPIDNDNDHSFVIITNINQRVIGYRIKSIINVETVKWDNTKAREEMQELTKNISYLTELNSKIARIVDIEQVYSNIIGRLESNDDEIISKEKSNLGLRVLIADDSSIARNQIKKVTEGLGCETVVFKDGKAAWDHLVGLKTKAIECNESICNYIQLVITDIEMPEMDGYTLTKKIKDDPTLKNLFVIIQSSIERELTSGVLDSVKADKFLTKWDPSVLINYIKSFKAE